MLTYHFTNDTRFEQVKVNLFSVAKHLNEGKWEHPTQTYDQAINGWYHVYTLYFGLYKEAVNVELVLSGKIDLVILEFIKKFQFPNPRKVNNQGMKEEIENNQLLAPLRTLIKLLFFCKIKGEKSELTYLDFEKYILLNEEVAKNKIDIEELYRQLSVRQLDEQQIDYFYSGGNKDRFTKQILGLMNSVQFIDVKNNMVKLTTDDLTEKNKSYLYDIINYDQYWDMNGEVEHKLLIESYKKYMQVQVNNDEDNKIESTFENDGIYNVIYYGAPGTGKSFEVSKKIKEEYPDFENDSSKDSEFVFRTTLHPEFTYSDFIGQIMPKVTKEKTEYSFYPSIFTRALKKALQFEKENKPVFLVLEELSRTNVAALFGDLFQLLDRKNGRSEYSITNSLIANEVYTNINDSYELEDRKIYLPENLYIYCTVNTNDQNVFVMDTAFKRRFDWIYISTKPVNKNNNPNLLIITQNGPIGYISWHNFYQKLNTYITKEMQLGEDKQIGQYFIQFDNNEKIDKKKIQNKLLQYLWEDVEKTAFNGVKLFSSEIENFADAYDKFDSDNKIFSSNFLSYIDKEVIYENFGEEINQLKTITIDNIYDTIGQPGKLLVEKIDEELNIIKEQTGWNFHKKAMNYFSFKYFSAEDKNRSGFLEISKGTNDNLLVISFRKKFVEDEILNSKSGRSDRKNLFDTIVQISTIEDFKSCINYIKESWSQANDI